MAKYHPSELETQVLSVLWEQGPSTVRHVLSQLPDGKQRAYTTVLTIMQGMEKKKLVSRTRDGAAHVYHPEVQREEVGQPVIKTLLKLAHKPLHTPIYIPEQPTTIFSSSPHFV